MGIASSQHGQARLWHRTQQFVVALLIGSAGSPGLAAEQDALASAEASFIYIASTLQTFHRTGRLAENPGIDGADLEHFIELLETFHAEFRRDFGRDSAVCTFYMDPNNSRMTIEDRAELSFSMLRNLSDRNARYVAVDAEFQAEVEDHFGGRLLAAINDTKETAVSSQRLPSAAFEQSRIINFLDTACGI